LVREGIVFQEKGTKWTGVLKKRLVMFEKKLWEFAETTLGVFWVWGMGYGV
jgi:hypothetical protein